MKENTEFGKISDLRRHDFFIVYDEILSYDISDTAFWLYCKLLSHAYEAKGNPFVSTTWASGKLRRSKTTINAALMELVTKRLIRQVSTKPKTGAKMYEILDTRTLQSQIPLVPTGTGTRTHGNGTRTHGNGTRTHGNGTRTHGNAILDTDKDIDIKRGIQQRFNALREKGEI